MSGAGELNLDSGNHRLPAPDGKCPHLSQNLLGVFHSIERLCGFVIRVAGTIGVLRIFLLKVRGIEEDNAHQIPGAGSAIHRAFESNRQHSGKRAAVIQMSVCDQDRIQTGQRLGDGRPVLLTAGFLSLKETAIHQNSLAMGGQDRLASRDLPCAAKELKLDPVLKMKFPHPFHAGIYTTSLEFLPLLTTDPGATGVSLVTSGYIRPTGGASRWKGAIGIPGILLHRRDIAGVQTHR